MSDSAPTAKVRLDRWLWAARFFKTRAQAKTAIEGGKVQFHLRTASADNTARLSRPKVSKEIAVGDTLTLRRGDSPETIIVTELRENRGSATVASTLYEETPESIETREANRSRQRMERLGLQVPKSRPTRKNDRRALQKLKRDN